MITEKSRPGGGGSPNNFAGHDFTAPLLSPSTPEQPCPCGMEAMRGQVGHERCADRADDALALDKVVLVTTTVGDKTMPTTMDSQNYMSPVTTTLADKPLTDAEISRALDIARNLARAGVPVFVAPPCPGESCTREDHPNPKSPFDLPKGWQKTQPDAAQVDRWRPGWALCAVGGHAVDVLDVDPQNGGDAGAAELRAAGAWPMSYGQASTPSGGTHDLIAPLQVGKGVPAQGVDLQGGKPDGTGLGFAFISPTVKKSKVDGIARPYRWIVEPDLSRLAVEGPTDTSGQGVARRITDKRTKPAVAEVPRQASSPAYGLPGASLAGDIDARVQTLCDELASAPEGDGNNTASRIAFMVGQYVGAGQLTAWEAESSLMAALSGWTFAQQGDEAAMRNTIRKQIAEGAKSPRVWEPTRNSSPGMALSLVRPVGQVGAAEQGSPAPLEERRIDLLRSRLRERLHTRDTLDTIEPPTPLIEGVLDKGTIALLSGKFGTYKTFVSLAWACSIATGTAWEGLPVVTPGPVLYVAAEGCSGLRSRVRAWEIGHYGGRRIPADRLAVLNGRVKLTDPDEMIVLGEFIRELRPVLVVIDTLHQCAPGMEENSSKDMGTVLGAVAELRERYGVTVLLNHHTGHQGERARGSSALEDDVDTSWVINLADAESRAAENQRTLKHRKAKDRELLADRPILLRTVEETGSAYVESGTLTPSALLPDGLVALKVIEWLDELGVPVNAGRDACRKALKDAGHVVPRNEVLADAIKRRKARGQVGQE